MELITQAIAALVCLVLLVTTVALLLYKHLNVAQLQQPAQEQAEEEDDQQIGSGGAHRGAGGRMRAGRLRQRAAAQQQQQQQQQQAGLDTGSSGGEEGSEEEGGQEEAGGRRNKKQRAREARREVREAERLAREARGQKVNLYEERRQKDEEREAQEAAQEAAIAEEAAARAAQEEEEARKWMSLITVEEEGTGEAEAGGEDPGLLGQFVDYIVARKMAPLEEIATEFNMRTTDVIDRIRGLEAMGRLTGVMDERGKYIYITLEEMQAVAKHLTKKGRMTISELAAQSSSLIDLEPRAVGTVGAGKRPMLDFEALAAED